MTPEVAYLIKVNVAFILFYGFYRSFFYKDTFFRLRRMILLSFYGVALFYPFCNFQDWLREQEPMTDVIVFYSNIIATPANHAAVQTSFSSFEFGLYAYLFICSLLFLRLIVQLFSILQLKYRSDAVHYGGTKIYSLRQPAGPFSFFNYIFIYLPPLSKKEKQEILTHELTHVRQWHSIDVLISEIVTICFWANPFVWFLRREIRRNLEYLADDKVVHSGYDSKSYQYHLLGLAHHQATAVIYNSFNVIHLKNRILMMNKRRSKGIFRIKYLTFIPLIAFLLLGSNVESVTRAANKLVKELTNTEGTGRQTRQTGKEEALLQSTRNNPPAVKKEEPGNEVAGYVEKAVLNGSLSQAKKEEKIKAQPYVAVEQMPAFPGGENALMKYVQTNLRYPKKSAEKGIEGRAILRFIIETDGSIANVEVLRGFDPECDAEAVRVVNNMPKWTPGMQNGKAVPVYFTLPVVYRLRGNEQYARHYSFVNGGNKDDIYVGVEQMPAFPGGENGLMEYIRMNVKYPTESMKKEIQGRVIVRFVVMPDGSVSDATVLRGLDPGCDAEAIRVTQNMPKWIPGKNKGKNVPVYFTLPIQFRLS